MISSAMRSRAVLFAAIGLITVLLPILTGCGGEVKTYSDHEETIAAKVAEEFVIALDFDLYHLWRETYDESMLSLMENTFEIGPENGEPSVAQHFRFKALEPGKAEIALEKKSTDGQTTIERRVFRVNIE
jgi:hypothetical protein